MGYRECMRVKGVWTSRAHVFLLTFIRVINPFPSILPSFIPMYKYVPVLLSYYFGGYCYGEEVVTSVSVLGIVMF